MKIIFSKKLIFFIFLFIIIYLNANVDQVLKKTKDIYLKVLLDERNAIFQNTFKIETDSLILLSSPSAKQKVIVKNQSLDVFVKDNKIKLQSFNDINAKNVTKTLKSDELNINSKSGKFKLNGTPYEGKLIFKINQQDNKLFIINKIKIEDYLYSVLISEIYPSWPHEMQKVQAIISRTYAIFHMKQNKEREKKLPYDIKKSNFHQKYTGLHNFKHVKKAIEETTGIILTHKNNIVLAMFDACCGGITPSKMNSIDFNKAPYLARNKPCNFCKSYQFYSWQAAFKEKDFLQKLKNNPNISQKVIGCGDIIKIFISKKDSAGIVKQVKLICSKKNITIPATQIKQSLSEKVLSLNFSIKNHNNLIVINGHGYGHQIGLCQRGAKELVDMGWDFKNIINFYYPEIEFSRLKHAQI